jgi:hypothetical protein
MADTNAAVATVAEFPVTSWDAGKTIGHIPTLGYRLRWGAKPGDSVRLYWEARSRSPMSRYHTRWRWEPVDDLQREHELRAAVQAGYPVMEVLAEVEWMLRTAKLERARRKPKGRHG